MRIIKETDRFGGEFIKCVTDEALSKHSLVIEKTDNCKAFVCSFREEPYFMSAKTGEKISEIPIETQWLGVLHQDNTYSVYFSIVDGQFRTSLFGDDNGIGVIALSGDSNVKGNEFYALYKISGDDFYTLVDNAAKSICEKFQQASHIADKKVPAFVNKFGWCTWDSFYEKVSAKDVVDGVKNFKEEGFVPKFLILDDGWQTTNNDFETRGEWRLKSFKANDKFNNNLSEVISEVKKNFGVEEFFVWHAVMGYWGGVDASSEEMKKYAPRLSVGCHTDELKIADPKRWEIEHFEYGIVDEDKVFDFYNDYHSYLKGEGVDGVKIDVQAAIEAHCEKFGGRVKLVKKFRNALEESVVKNFDGEMINCMSCSNDIIYNTKKTTVMRSSCDFFPEVEESHAKHIFLNAINSIWMSRFVICDWDMFQTKHEYGNFHAAARALSGGPVYVSDRVGVHNFDVIRSLVDDDGNVLRAKNTALPTMDCIFGNPLDNKLPYKIFNENQFSSVVGVFSFDKVEKTACISEKDFSTSYENAVIFSRKNNTLYFGDKNDIAVSLKEKEFDILTMSEIKDGFAVIGIESKLNCGATVNSIDITDDSVTLRVNSSGRMVCYSEKLIKRITQNGENIVFSHNNNDLRFDVAGDISKEIVVEFI